MSYLDNLFGLSGQTILVTGASRGIGATLAEALEAAGATVIRSVRTLPEDGPSTGKLFVTCELGDASQVATLISRASEIAPTPLTGLVNCGGINRRHTADTFPESEYGEVMQVNLHATWRLCRDFASLVLSRSPDTGSSAISPSIVNLASVMSYQGGVGVSAYAATKHAVVGLTKAMSNEWAPQGIRVNALAPGYIATDLITALRQDEKRNNEILNRTPAGRYGKPEELAGAVIYLLSKAAAWTTGETLVVDGGWLGR
ncbi:hypothetical protein PYCC9005_002375 [Savitreella phatthalungensis]